MLYKNDEVVILNDAEIKGIEKQFHGKFPVKVVYPPERIVKSKLKHNRLPDKPASISFDLKSTVKTPKGAEVWRYAENIVIDNKGRKRYLPKKFRFNGARYLERNDIELIFFLFNKSEFCMGGRNQGRIVKFMFEDLVSEAEKKNERREIETKIATLLYGQELALSEEKLRRVAKAYFVKNVDSMTLSQVKIIIENKIHESKNGPDRFFDMVNADDEIKTRVSIQRVIDMEILRYDGQKRIWYWQIAGEKGTTQVCKVPPNKSANESLYDFYMGDESFRDDLQAVLITKNPSAGKVMGKGGSDIEDSKEE